ncbi:MAG: hypothetical protein BWY35_01386 [Firmicutes bacterium ADurb.Bin248]|nr:MAG: hypothetical protein BWY35_01386 [Firmicutes bacterium ADurb.Bin248]
MLLGHVFRIRIGEAEGGEVRVESSLDRGIARSGRGDDVAAVSGTEGDVGGGRAIDVVLGALNDQLYLLGDVDLAVLHREQDIAVVGLAAVDSEFRDILGSVGAVRMDIELVDAILVIVPRKLLPGIRVGDGLPGVVEADARGGDAVLAGRNARSPILVAISGAGSGIGDNSQVEHVVIIIDVNRRKVPLVDAIEIERGVIAELKVGKIQLILEALARKQSFRGRAPAGFLRDGDLDIEVHERALHDGIHRGDLLIEAPDDGGVLRGLQCGNRDGDVAERRRGGRERVPAARESRRGDGQSHCQYHYDGKQFLHAVSLLLFFSYPPAFCLKA